MELVDTTAEEPHDAAQQAEAGRLVASSEQYAARLGSVAVEFSLRFRSANSQFRRVEASTELHKGLPFHYSERAGGASRRRHG